MNTLINMPNYGRNIWLDLPDCKIMDFGEFKKLIDEDGIRELTSNRAIFEKPISNSSVYDDDIALLSKQKTATIKSFLALQLKILNVPSIFLNRYRMKPKAKMIS